MCTSESRKSLFLKNKILNLAEGLEGRVKTGPTGPTPTAMVWLRRVGMWLCRVGVWLCRVGVWLCRVGVWSRRVDKRSRKHAEPPIYIRCGVLKHDTE